MQGIFVNGFGGKPLHLLPCGQPSWQLLFAVVIHRTALAVDDCEASFYLEVL
ncbi:hypothetical protein [Dendronalium phyllosphericum]|uniref:hypothetical protein n=1 Tax=Dendronalium phyllosphericum TaxID=2840445 RepID=UPI001BDD412A|nr:hypothetical protein [Dendronalium phyllosphericum]